MTFDQLQNLLPWQLVLSIAVLSVVGMILAILDRTGVPVRNLWPWVYNRLQALFEHIHNSIHWGKSQLLRLWSVGFKTKESLHRRWDWITLTKGWRKMNVNLTSRNIWEDLNRDVSSETRKMCVAIKLDGIASTIDANGKTFQESRQTMIAQVVNRNDREIMVNARNRDVDKYVLFLAQAASSIVEKWDKNKLGDEDAQRKWLENFEIPHKVLMDYLGDVLECDGEWNSGSK